MSTDDWMREKGYRTVAEGVEELAEEAEAERLRVRESASGIDDQVVIELPPDVPLSEMFAPDTDPCFDNPSIPDKAAE